MAVCRNHSGLSGGQLAELLSEKRSEMKVLFMSGYAEKIVHNHKIVQHMTNFLQKPFTMQALARKIRELPSSRAAAASASAH